MASKMEYSKHHLNPTPEIQPLRSYLVSRFRWMIISMLFHAQFCKADPLDEWSRCNSGVQVNLRCVTYGNGNFIAAGDSGTILISVDGISWSNCISETGQSLTGVIFGSNSFTAVGNG